MEVSPQVNSVRLVKSGPTGSLSVTAANLNDARLSQEQI